MACSANPDSDGDPPSTGGTFNTGGSAANHSGTSSGASTGTSGSATNGTSGSTTTGGSTSGGPPTGGSTSGSPTTGGSPFGGSSFGGSRSFGGAGSGGTGFGTAGDGGGGRANGGAGGGGSSSAGSGGAGSSNGGAPALDCNAVMPTNGTKHTGNGQGGKDNLAWQLWANNANNGSVTTFTTPAFGAEWSNAGDFLARIGYEWGNAGKSYDAYGTITAQLAYKRTGDGGGYSYIGIYGWSNNPCIEWYIVDDSFKGMPVNPGNTTNKGTVKIGGDDYILYTRQTTGTGGSRCNVSSWTQYYSIRKTARQCGTIPITEHFNAWKTAEMPLGNLLEAKVLVEVGGGTGSVEFPVANVTLSN